MRKLALAALVFPSLTATAIAETYSIGARVGGYGFRREAATQDAGFVGATDSARQWDECRMNGLGIFGSRGLRGPLFVEAGLDMYSSIERAQAQDLPLDRTSGLISAAVGARAQVTSWLGGYIQLGAGVELTSLSVPYGQQRIRDHQALPEGFFGVGADLRLGKRTHVGANLRTLVMGNFDYDPARLDMSNGWIAPPPASEVFDASPDVAAQAQFYLRREL